MPDVLTDDELLALPNGHPLLGKLTPEEAQRRTSLQLGRPMGGESGRVDTNILGLDRDRLGQMLSGVTGSLDPTWQRPAASMAGNLMASLIEALSAPESLVSMGGPAAMRGLGRVGAATQGVIPAATNAVTRGAAKVGEYVDPDFIGVISPRAGKAVEAAQKLRAKMGPTSSPAASPAATPPAAAPPSPAPSGPPLQGGGLRLTPEESQALQGLLKQGYREEDIVREIAKRRPQAPPSRAPRDPNKPMLQAAETKEYTRLRRSGKSHQEAMDLILAQRAFVAGKGLPTAEQARGAVADRNATGRWRDD